MSRSDDTPHPGVYEYRDAMQRARKSLNRYEHERLAIASGGDNPDDHPNLIERKLEMHTAVMSAYRQLRGHISRQLPEYWGGTNTEEDGPLIYEYSDGSVIQGLKDLDDFQGQVRVGTTEKRTRNRGVEVREVAQPYLLPHTAARRVVNLLSECMVELEFAAQPSERTVISEVPKDGVDV